MKADVRVILTKMEEREKKENRRLVILGIIIGGSAALLSAPHRCHFLARARRFALVSALFWANADVTLRDKQRRSSDNMLDANKQKVIDQAISQIEREFGKGSIMRFADSEVVPVEAIPTGSLALDLALGVGGVPRGRIVEIYGHEGTGKTTLALHIVAEVQKLGGTAVFVDVEHALDTTYARNIGVNMENLLIAQPDAGEQALEIVETLIRSGAIDLVVIDSVAALTPQAEIEGEMGDAHVGLLPRLMSKALRKLSGVTNKSQTCVIFTNQIRQKIGVMFGNPDTTPGGLALKFHASVRLELRRGQQIKDGTDVLGTGVRVKVVKNKSRAAFQRSGIRRDVRQRHFQSREPFGYRCQTGIRPEERFLVLLQR